MQTKYLNPLNYLDKAKSELIKLNFKLGRPMTVKISALGQSILFKTITPMEYFLRAKQSYTREPTTMYWIENYIKKDDVVYDIGANVGAYSLLIGSLVRSSGGSGRVYAFEPESQNCASLNRNIILNNLSDYIRATSLAFGSKLKAGNFYLSSIVSGSALHSLDAPQRGSDGFQTKHTQGVIAISLDEFVKLENVQFPNHIKIDVDGLESIIVDNMHGLLADLRLKTINIELDEHTSYDKVQQIIKSHGFKGENEEELKLKTDCNFLFERI